MGLVALIVMSLVIGKSDEKVVLNYAEVNALEGTAPGVMATAFKEKVEELSGGDITVDIHASGVLGSDDQVLDNMLGGGNMTDIARFTAFSLVQYGCEKASLLSMPYTFGSVSAFEEFRKSDLSREFLNEPQEVGLPVRGLCYAQEGFRTFFFRKPVKSLADMKDLKIRVSNDPVMVGMMGDLGASATSVSFTELYSALSTGVVDGAEQPVPNYYANMFHEVAPYMIADGHTLGIMEMVISEYRWQRLTEQQRAWVTEAAEYAATRATEEGYKLQADVVDKLTKAGVTVAVLDDYADWREAVRPTVEKFTADQKELYQKIVDINASLGSEVVGE